MCLVIPQVARFQILKLSIKDDGADNEADGKGELKHHETFPDEPGASAWAHQLSFQRGRRIEGGQVKCGVAAGDQPAKDADSHQRCKVYTFERLNVQLLIDKCIEHGHKSVDEIDRQNDGDEGHHKGFQNKLQDQGSPHSPQRFSDPDFEGTSPGPCGCKVHEIDAGNEDNDPGDRGDNIDKDDAAAFRMAVGKLVVDVPVVHRPEHAACFCIQAVLGAQDGCYLAADPIRVSAGAQFHE